MLAMLAHWTDRLVVVYAKATYYYTATVGITVFSLEQGRLRPLSKKLRYYAWIAGLVPVVLGCFPLINAIVRTQLSAIVENVAMHLAVFLYIVAFNLFLMQLKIMQFRQQHRVYKFIAQLLRLRRNTEALMSRSLPTTDKAFSLFQICHTKFFTFFALFTLLYMLLFDVSIVASQYEDPTFSVLFYNVITLKFDLITKAFSIAYTLALLLFDAICCRLQQILSYIAPSRYSPPTAEQQLTLHYLLKLYAWHLECNRLWSPAVFLYYSMVFFEALCDFYVVFSQHFDGFTNHPMNYVKMLMKLLAPYMINLIAEHARLSFKRATDTVAFQVRYGRRGRFREQAYLLQLQEKQISFRCFNLFRIDRALTISLFAQIFSYIITLVQFNIENSQTKKTNKET